MNRPKIIKTEKFLETHPFKQSPNELIILARESSIMSEQDGERLDDFWIWRGPHQEPSDRLYILFELQKFVSFENRT